MNPNFICPRCGKDAAPKGNTVSTGRYWHTECLRNHNAWVLYKRDAAAFAKKRADKYRIDAGMSVDD